VVFLPGTPQLRRCDIPVRSALLTHRTQVLTQLFQCGPSEEPIAAVNVVDDQIWFKDKNVGNHRIVRGIGIFGGVQILLENTTSIREEGPMCADSATVFVRFCEVIGAEVTSWQ